MRDTSTKFPNQIDSRTFFSDIDLSQVPIMKNYYTLQNAGNYTKASELLNNSEVFFYGAWWLNMMENRLNAIGDYALNKIEKPKLVDFCDAEPNDVHQGTNWISNDDMIELREDYLQITDINMYFGEDKPSDNSEGLKDTWIANGEDTTTKINKEDVNLSYQTNEPETLDEKYDIWIGDD